MIASRLALSRSRRAARQFASTGGVRAYLPNFSTVVLGGTLVVVGGGLAYDRWETKIHQSSID